MRDLSTRMIEAVLDGEGLRGVAELAAAEAGGPVAIVLPARGLAARAPGEADLNGLAEYTRERVADANPAPPEPIAHEASIEAGGERVGLVLLLAGEGEGEGAGARRSRRGAEGGRPRHPRRGRGRRRP